MRQVLDMLKNYFFNNYEVQIIENEMHNIVELKKMAPIQSNVYCACIPNVY